MEDNSVFRVCDLDGLYSDLSDYKHYLPKGHLENYLSGTAFDYPHEYTEEEKSALIEDIQEIYDGIMSNSPEKKLETIMTAGPPGAGKTTLLRNEIKKYQDEGKNYAYICPDDVVLQNQQRTYLRDLADVDSEEGKRAAYNKWRSASIFGREVVLGNLIRQKIAFFHGTTSTSLTTVSFLSFLKEKGYHIKILHVSTQDYVRKLSIEERDKDFLHASKKDVIDKGLLFPQRIMDCYLKFADQIDFHYRRGPKSDAVLAARWTRISFNEIFGEIRIEDNKAYNDVKKFHNQKCKVLKREDLRWEETVEKVSTIRRSSSPPILGRG